MDLTDVLELIKNGDWQDEINNVRSKVAANASEKEIGEVKNTLNYFTASGTFTTRNDAGLIQHSGLLALDFDKLAEYTTIEDAWKAITSDKYTHHAFLSCTGRGICAIVHIDPSKHLDSFRFFSKYYKKHYGLILDESGKDISRPRFISYDPNLFTNPNYETLELTNHNGATTTIDDDSEKFDWVVNVMNKKHAFVEGNRHNYLVIMAFFLNKVGVSQDYTAHRYMSDYAPEMHDDKEVQRIIRDCYKSTSDHGTFVINKSIKDLPPEFAADTKEVYKHAFGMNADGRRWTDADVDAIAARYSLSISIVKGIFTHVYKVNEEEFGIDHKPDIVKVEVFIKKRWKLLRNEVSKRIQARVVKDGKETFELVNENNISRELMHASIKFPLQSIRSLLDSDFVEKWNPFNDYFDKLPTWDEREEPDYISELADFVRTDNQEFWRVQFKKALVRSIACAIDNIENRIIITLVGDKQETGKSNFIRFLCPEVLKDYYTESELMAGEKDSDMQLSENIIWNLEELAALNSNEVNKLKAIISKSTVKQRRAYDRYHDVNPRRVTFWASTNKNQFLADDSNTRWLCFNVESIDHDYNNFKTGVRKVNINNVWAQAMSLYRSGFNFNLTDSEAGLRDVMNKEYETSSTEKELIQKYFSVCSESERDNGIGSFMTRTEILWTLKQVTDYKLNFHEAAISRALKQLGHLQSYNKKNNVTVRGWHVLNLSTAGNDMPVIKKEPAKDWSARAERDDEEQGFVPDDKIPMF